MNGLPTTVIQQDAEDRIFNINAGDFDEIVLADLVLEGGSAPSSGGGIWVDTGLAQVDLNNVRLSNNTAENLGGGIYLDDGDLRLNGVDLVGNRVGGNGSAIAIEENARVVIERSSIRENGDLVPGGIASHAILIESLAAFRCPLTWSVSPAVNSAFARLLCELASSYR